MKFPCEGRWWLPGSQDRSVFGTLTFTRRDGAVLSLADSLTPESDDPETEIIVGQTASGAYVTMLHAIRTAAPLFRLTPVFPCSYHSPVLITGATFDRPEEIRFSYWQVRFPELRAWVNKRSFEVQSSELFARRDCPAVQIAYSTPPKQVLLSAAGGTNLSLGFWPLLTTDPDVATIRQDVYLEVRQADCDTLEHYMQTATRFEHLLTLATGSLVRTESIKAIVRTTGTGTANEPILVDILYQPIRDTPPQHGRRSVPAQTRQRCTPQLPSPGWGSPFSHPYGMCRGTRRRRLSSCRIIN